LSQPLLELRDVTCERDGYPLFEPVSLTLSAGSVMQLEGPNGVGKTSLLRVLCGLSSRYQGELRWRGQPLDRAAFATEVIFLGHATGLKLTLSPRENLRWWGVLRGFDCTAEIDGALRQVGLLGYEDVPCYQLSAGQQRRVALARLFTSTAPLWILDEPFTAIDREGVAQLEEWLLAHAEAGGAVLLTTHQPLTLPVPLQQVGLRPAQGEEYSDNA
jgi:heme exporter protein A